MRAVADAERIRRFMDALGRRADADTRVFLAGGATAVLLGWRASTIDIDLKMLPERDALLRAIPELKETLQLNVELASPVDFIPVPAGWEERSRFIDQIGRASFYHFDLYAQVLSKIERGHRQDLADVREMVARELIDPARVLDYFDRAAGDLYRYPAVDPRSYRRAVEAAIRLGP